MRARRPLPEHPKERICREGQSAPLCPACPDAAPKPCLRPAPKTGSSSIRLRWTWWWRGGWRLCVFSYPSRLAGGPAHPDGRGGAAPKFRRGAGIARLLLLLLQDAAAACASTATDMNLRLRLCCRGQVDTVVRIIAAAAHTGGRGGRASGVGWCPASVAVATADWNRAGETMPARRCCWGCAAASVLQPLAIPPCRSQAALLSRRRVPPCCCAPLVRRRRDWRRQDFRAPRGRHHPHVRPLCCFFCCVLACCMQCLAPSVGSQLQTHDPVSTRPRPARAAAARRRRGRARSAWRAACRT